MGSACAVLKTRAENKSTPMCSVQRCGINPLEPKTFCGAAESSAGAKSLSPGAWDADFAAGGARGCCAGSCLCLCAVISLLSTLEMNIFVLCSYRNVIFFFLLPISQGRVLPASLRKLPRNKLGLWESRALYSSSVGFRAWKSSVGSIWLCWASAQNLPSKSRFIYRAGVYLFPFREISCLMANWLFNVNKKAK